MGEGDLEKHFGESSDKDKAEAQAMIRSQARDNQIAKYLIDTQDKTQLMDMLMRTVFASREELLIFNDYVAWCDDFNVSMDNARRYVAARPAVDGLARRQLVEALTYITQGLDHRGRKSSYDQKDAKKLPD